MARVKFSINWVKSFLSDVTNDAQESDESQRIVTKKHRMSKSAVKEIVAGFLAH